MSTKKLLSQYRYRYYWVVSPRPAARRRKPPFFSRLRQAAATFWQILFPPPCSF